MVTHVLSIRSIHMVYNDKASRLKICPRHVHVRVNRHSVACTQKHKQQDRSPCLPLCTSSEGGLSLPCQIRAVVPDAAVRCFVRAGSPFSTSYLSLALALRYVALQEREGCP